MHSAAHALIAVFSAALLAGCAGTRHVAGPSFRDNDYPEAVAHAKDARRPLFIDAWAPWCHTCLSMRAFVLSDPSLRPYYDRFVWLAMDVDAPTSAEFLARYPVGSLPTFLVIDPATGEVTGRWLGAMTVAELRQFLDDSALVQARPSEDVHLAMLRTGHRLLLAGETQKARTQYRTLLDSVASHWPRRLETLVAALDAASRQGDVDAARDCVELATQELPWVTQQQSPQAGDFVAYANDCAGKLPPEEAPRARMLREKLVSHLVKMIDDRTAPLSVDDRGDALGLLYGLYEQLGREALLRPTAERRQRLLEDAAAAITDPAVQATFDWARVETALWLGQTDHAIALLQAREKQLPRDYNPPHRLARVYLKLRRFDDALAASDRAIRLAYGPRQIEVRLLRADVLEASGAALSDARSALAAVLEARSALEKLSLSQQKARHLAAIAERIKRLQTRIDAGH